MTASGPTVHAVVLGLDDGLTGIQSARILARRGVPVVGLTNDRRHPYARTRVCDRVVHARTKDDDLVATLLTLGPQFEERPVLFPCQDSNVDVVSRHRRQLSAYYRIVLPPTASIELLMDKARFHAFAVENGFRVPDTTVLSNRADAEAAAGALPYPCILKPTVRTPAWNRATAIKAFVVGGPDELLRRYDEHQHLAETMLAQELIPGPETAHYTCNLYVDATGEPVLTHVSRKLRQWPIATGQGCASVSVDDDEIRLLAERFFASLDFLGLGYLEIKRHAQTGEEVLIEPNVGRPTGRSAAADAAGTELLYSLYCDALGLPRPAAPAPSPEPTTWVFLRQDVRS
ncbi:MAG: carboxylate--amine ligase, partial [Actinomycetota bacterium]